MYATYRQLHTNTPGGGPKVYKPKHTQHRQTVKKQKRNIT